MSGTAPPLACASSRAAAIWTGLLSRPKNWVAALPEMLVVQPLRRLGREDQAQPVLAGLGGQRERALRCRRSSRRTGRSVCASSITNSPPSGRSPAGLRLIQANSAI